MKPKLHFLCRFMKRTDSSGRIYFAGTLGNSRLLLYPTAEGELSFYLGEQVDAGPAWMKGKGKNGSK